MTVGGAESCRPVEAVTALGNFAVAVECLTKTGLEDPPTTLVELVWTGDDGWVWHVQPDSELGSVDYSPQGQYAVFTTNSEYGRPHHVTSYHADLGWRDLTRRELGRSTRDDLVAAINDSGNVVALRGAGSEDEPGYWFGGRLRIETYDDTSGKWTQRFARDLPRRRHRPDRHRHGRRPLRGDTGPVAIDRRAHRPRRQGRRTVRQAEQPTALVVTSLEPAGPHRFRGDHSGRRRGRRLASGRKRAHRQAVVRDVGAEAQQPSVHDLKWRTTLTDAAVSGLAMDMSVSANGRGVIAYVRHRRGVDHSTVGGASFRVGRDGALSGQIDATWQQPVDTTVNVTASASATSITLGGMIGPFYPSPETRYSVVP